MLIKGSEILEQNGRRAYPLGENQIFVQHFVIRVTNPDNPFGPHQHQQPELWYVIDGQALVSLDGREQLVEASDLIIIEPWIEHGLRTESQVTWICLG